jgi:arylsulfatase A-like enzyme
VVADETETLEAPIQNVLFVCADDLNGWIGPLGRYPGIRTPNIDALAARGTVFTHAYCAAPHCNPSRASVFTGQRPTTTGVYLNERLPQRPELVTMPEQFRRSGYEVFGAGKVFHGQFDYPTATRDYAPSARWHDSHNEATAWTEFHPCDDEPLPDGRPFNRFFDFRGREEIPDWYGHFDWGPLPEHLVELLPDTRVASRSVEFLRRPHPRPFFCAVGFYRPHLPWYVPRRFFDLYPLDQIELPFVLDTDLDQVPEIPRRWARTPDDHALVTQHGQWRHAVQGYLASIS